MESAVPVAASAVAISSGCRPVSAQSSLTVGSRSSAAISRCRAPLMKAARSLRLRLTFTVPSSRRKRRISPAIFGTA